MYSKFELCDKSRFLSSGIFWKESGFSCCNSQCDKLSDFSLLLDGFSKIDNGLFDKPNFSKFGRFFNEISNNFCIAENLNIYMKWNSFAKLIFKFNSTRK